MSTLYPGRRYDEVGLEKGERIPIKEQRSYIVERFWTEVEVSSESHRNHL